MVPFSLGLLVRLVYFVFQLHHRFFLSSTREIHECTSWGAWWGLRGRIPGATARRAYDMPLDSDTMKYGDETIKKIKIMRLHLMKYQQFLQLSNVEPPNPVQRK